MIKFKRFQRLSDGKTSESDGEYPSFEIARDNVLSLFNVLNNVVWYEEHHQKNGVRIMLIKDKDHIIFQLKEIKYPIDEKQSASQDSTDPGEGA